MSEVVLIDAPEGWAVSGLKELTSKLTDGSHNPPKKQDHGLPMLSAKNVENGFINWDASYRLITEEGFELENKRTRIEAGDVLLTIVGTIGRSCVVPANMKPFTLQRSVAVISPIEINPKYISYQLLSSRVQNYLHTNSKGTAQKGIYLKSLGQLPILVAPPEQQKRIVAKIEELFSHIDAGIAALNKAKQLLKQYRQSVLKAAVTGELLGNAFTEDLFKSIDHGLVTLGQGWSPRCEKEPSPDENTWGVIKTTAVQSLEYRQEENKRLPDALEPRQNHEVLVDDLLVTRAGPRVRVGICCLVKETRKKLMICDKVYRLRVQSDVILPEYLELVLNAPNVLSEIEKLKSGINDSGVNLTQNKFVQLQIPYPSIEDQKSLIQIVTYKIDSISRLDEEIGKQLLKAEKSKQSLLASAFSGKLGCDVADMGEF
jgi:type I restriction enzyme S subunit